MKKAPWNPTTIKRFIQAFPTSARTVLVETDAGKGYLKALGSPEGPHILACEWVGTHLAKWFGLSTFDVAIIQVTATDQIPFHGGGSAEPGPAFIARAVSGERWSGSAKQFRRLANPGDISRLVVFDTWTRNCDRHSWWGSGKSRRERIKRDNVFLSEEAPRGKFMLKAMDHTHCFTCGKELSPSLADIGITKDLSVYGLFPEFRPFLDLVQVRRAIRDLRRLGRAEVVRFIQSVPMEWKVPEKALAALRDFLLVRARFVADNIEGQLFEQGEFDFECPEERE